MYLTATAYDRFKMITMFIKIQIPNKIKYPKRGPEHLPTPRCITEATVASNVLSFVFPPHFSP